LKETAILIQWTMFSLHSFLTASKAYFSSRQR